MAFKVYVLLLISILLDSIVLTLHLEADNLRCASWRMHEYDTSYRILYCMKSLEICKNKPFFWLFVSGYFLQTPFPPSQRSFQGCMQAILVDNQPADLHAVEKGTVGAFENVSLDLCAIIDR